MAKISKGNQLALGLSFAGFLASGLLGLTGYHEPLLIAVAGILLIVFLLYCVRLWLQWRKEPPPPPVASISAPPLDTRGLGYGIHFIGGDGNSATGNKVEDANISAIGQTNFKADKNQVKSTNPDGSRQ